MVSHYLNTDLCLRLGSESPVLRRAMSSAADVPSWDRQPDGRWYATVNALDSGSPDRTPQQDVDALLALLRSLSPEAAAQWRSCDLRELNIGWQSGPERPEGAFKLNPSSLAACAEQGLTLAVTVYPSSENDRVDA